MSPFLAHALIFAVYSYWITVTLFFYSVFRVALSFNAGRLAWRDYLLAVRHDLMGTNRQRLMGIGTQHDLNTFHHLRWTGITYLLAGAHMAVIFNEMTPPTNGFGMLYLTLVWLPWQLQMVFGYTMPVPAWVFTF